MSAINLTKVIILGGGGDLPKIIAKDFNKKKIKFHTIGFENNLFNNYLKKYPHTIINFGKIVTHLKKLRADGFKELILVGGLNRPNVSEIRPDFNSIKLFPFFVKKILQGGDNNLLSFAIEKLEKMRFKILNLSQILPNLFPGKGNITKKRISKQLINDAIKAKLILDCNSKFDIGQSLIIEQGTIIGIESIEGTDSLIKRSKKYIKSNGSNAILVKLSKISQDSRADLPTIGLTTVKNCFKNKIGGIVYQSKKTIFIDKIKILEFCNTNNIFLYGIE